MDFIVKKTTDLNEEEIISINNLFNEVFDKTRPVEEFKNQFFNTPLGYSYHSLIIDDGHIVGHNGGMPSWFMVNGEKELFFNNVDTMIKKGYRGIENFYDMMTNSTKQYKASGATMLYGFPNDMSYPIIIKAKILKDIGKLNVYCLPYRMGGLTPKLRLFNVISKISCWTLLLWDSIFAKKKVIQFPVAKEAESYNATRYHRSDGNYTIVALNGFSLIYKIIVYQGIKSAFIIDITNKSAKNFAIAVRYLLKNERRNFDIILYVGILPFKNHGLIKIPHKFEPKHFNFTGLPLVKNKASNSVYMDITNWDINLSNYDLI